MVTNVDDQAYSDLAIPPGELLEEELKARGMSQKELSLRTGRPEQTISEIINGRKSITEDTALELEKVLAIPAHIWVNLEADYHLTLARNRDREALERQEDWLGYFPVKQLGLRGYITVARDKQKVLASILQFFGVASFSALIAREQALLGQYRMTQRAEAQVSKGALWAWLRIGANEARAMQLPAYHEGRFRRALREIRPLTTLPIADAVKKARILCAEAGVALVPVQEFPKSGANGVTRWLASDRAMIQLSTRFNWADIFWFTFYHEAKHVLDREKKLAIVDLKGERRINATPKVEEKANEFARDMLIPLEDWSEFVARDPQSAVAVNRFAGIVGIAPGIVVGRLQYEKRIPYKNLNGLRKRIVWNGD